MVTKHTLLVFHCLTALHSSFIAVCIPLLLPLVPSTYSDPLIERPCSMPVLMTTYKSPCYRPFYLPSPI